MDLRQVLEASAWAGYAMAFKETDKFYLTDEKGLVSVPSRLQGARNSWLDKNFRIKSDELRNLKNLINESTAHSNIIYTFQNFKVQSAGTPGFHTPFFDFEDEYKVKSDLWFIANMAMGILDMFYGINLQYKVFQIAEIFQTDFQGLVDQNHKLKAEMMNHKRYLASDKKLKEG